MKKSLKEIIIDHPISSIILVVLVFFTLFYIVQLSNRMIKIEENMEKLIELQRREIVRPENQENDFEIEEMEEEEE